ncbi:MAG: iron ABC transporter permease [Bacteroidales bacterium]|nr:iron ABC transporter permease [Bacteroidales bacterium]
MFGEVSFSLNNIVGILNSGEGNLKYAILMKIRLPRIVLGIAVGGSLSLSGAILQGIYRNPLVEPYTLGISGGAALAVSLVIVSGLESFASALALPLAGFTGSIAVIFFVYFFSVQRGNLQSNNMLLTGVMISFIASSLMMLLMAVASNQGLRSIIFWTMGSLDEPNILLIKIALTASFTGLFFSYFFARDLNALRLGEEKAVHLGVNSTQTIRFLFIIASLLTGISVAVAGIIGFVGLIIPHMMRLLAGNDYRILLLSSFLGGAGFLILSDTLARTIISPNELPVGVITGIVGGFAFMIILRKKYTI